MSELLKDIYNEAFLFDFGKRILAVHKPFSVDNFITDTMDGNWGELELKKRMRKISETLGKYLPADYEEAVRILFAIEESCYGFPYLILPDFVEVYGQAEKHWELSMEALERFTRNSSSEFAIRPFLIKDTDRGMKQMAAWSRHGSEHVRRLASEGCRPRLPWGISLPMFKTDPGPVIGILEQLKEDSSLYVRKSVANNLNDIAKDNPEIVLETAYRWKGVHPHTDWILRQGLRTLIRRAEPKALGLFGYPENAAELVKYAHLQAEPSVLRIGETCDLKYEIEFCEGTSVHFRIEYGIDFVKANGSMSRKLFLLTDKTVKGGTRIKGTRSHSWEDLTIRRHYPGKHRIVLLINGQEAAGTTLILNA